jgi:predicted transcriptional regulator
MDTDASEQWREERTTFERVYDVLLGTESFQSARTLAEHADCSESGARKALEQLVEMGVAAQRSGRPAEYRRNESYLEWKRVEALANEHSPETLRTRVGELIERDEAFQTQYGVPDPDAISTADIPVDDHDTLHDRWADLGEWRTIRRDIRLLRRAIERADRRVGDGLRA